MNRLSAAPLRLCWLAAVASVLALSASSGAVEPYRLPSAKPKNQGLDEAKSMKAHKLTKYRAVEVTPFTPRKNDFPSRYTRKHEGTKRMSR